MKLRIPIALSLFATFLNLDAAAESKKAPKPNVILIITDDLGNTGLSSWGSSFYETPHIDALAKSGVLFKNFYSASCLCSPARASLMTGKYPQRVGITEYIESTRKTGPHSHETTLPQTEVTLGEAFKKNGYQTGYIGKWHLGAEAGGWPKDHGFDWAMASCEHGAPGSYFFPYKHRSVSVLNVPDLEDGKAGDYLTDVITDKAIGFIRESSKATAPFFLTLSHYAVHTPLEAPQHLVEKYKKKRLKMYGTSQAPFEKEGGYRNRLRQGNPTYAAMTESLDTNIGKLLASLKRLNIYDNTIIAFVADNGGESTRSSVTSNIPYRAGKVWNYEGGIRVPAFIVWPKHIKPFVMEEKSITMDLYPTLLDLAGLKLLPEQHIDGVSFKPLILGERNTMAKRIIGFWHPHMTGAPKSGAYINGDWKIVNFLNGKPSELYDLSKDISERKNLASTYPNREKQMTQDFRQWVKSTNRTHMDESKKDTQETASPQPSGWIPKPLSELPELFAASIHGSPNVDIAVPNGPYTLQLLLYEGWQSRAADIVIEGKTVRVGYDMFKEQGGNFDHGSVLRHTFTLTDGNIDIEIKGPLHLGGLILSKGKVDSPDRVTIVKSPAALDLKDVIKTINFGHTKGLNIGDVKFAAAAVNTTVDGVTNTAGGDVHSGEFGQQIPQIQKEKTALKNTEFFNGKDFTGWAASERKYWSIKDGAIVGHSAVNVPKNEFIWSDVEVKDFYLTVDVKLTPDARNAGIQFRSKPVDAYGQALGYQADIGAGVWGKLYHEHGRGKLDWNNNADGVVKPDDWNRYEILAVGHKIWTAINGKLCVALEDTQGELSGKISFQIHGGPAQTVLYRNPTLVHNPKIALEKQTEAQLLAALPKKAEAPKPTPQKPISTPLPHWTRMIMAIDPGSQGEAWAKPAFDHKKWKTMEVPGHFQNAGLPGHDGVVWFRKTIELSAEQAKSKAILNLGQIDDMDVTWINGKRVGGYENPGHHYTVRKYPITAGLLKTGKNAIAVRVMDHASPGGIAGKPEQLSLQLGKETVSLANLWHFAPGANLNALNKYAALANHALLRPLTKPVAPIPGFANGFVLKDNQSIVIVGGANAAECQRYGYLETLLVSANPSQQLHMRNMAWAADTVYTQQRPRNFFAVNKPGYGERDRRPPMAVDVMFIWFGQMESLEGTARLDDFTKAYIEILTQFSGYTGRLVMMTPVPFEDPLSLGLKVKDRNAVLGKYASAIRQIANDRKLPVVDLFTALSGKAVTTDGLLLSRKGQQLAAQAFAHQLGFSPKLLANAEPLRQVILKKNALWQQYWFPSNWAFLYGNRQQTASSRSHLNGSHRWFPEEIQSIATQLKQMDQAIKVKASLTP